MSWNIERYHDGLLPDLAGIYNHAVSGIPFHWPVSAEEYAASALQNRPSRAGAPIIHDEVLIGYWNDRPAAFIHYGARQESSKRRSNCAAIGVIQALFAGDAVPGLVRALIDQAVQRMKLQEIRQIIAWPRENGYPFYAMGRGGCWEGLGLHRAFTESGFCVPAGDPPEDLYATVLPRVRAVSMPGLPVRFQYAVDPGGSELNGTVFRHFADIGGCRVGECHWHTLQRFQWHPEACRVAYIERLRVLPPVRREGVTATLLLQAFQAMAGQGIRAVLLHCRRRSDDTVRPLLESLGFVRLGSSQRYIMTLQ